MTDIVERLRLLVPSDPSGASIDAIAEIERLRAALREIAGLGVVCASDIAVVALRDAHVALEGRT